MSGPPLKILAVDISGLFSTHWEINQGKENSHAFNATLEAISKARDGFDRVALCCDGGVSWRRSVWPEYKANRVDRGAAYRHQIRRTIERLEAEACTVFESPRISTTDAEKEYFAEADDVIASLCAWATVNGHSVTILTGDKDLCQLVTANILVLNYSGILRGEKEVLDKFGVPPKFIPDLLALMGDKSDNFKLCDGIGHELALRMLKKAGSLMALFEPQHWDDLEGVIGKAATAKFKLVDRKRAEAALQISTTVKDLPIDFDNLSQEPVWRKVEPAIKVDFAPAPALPQSAPERVPPQVFLPAEDQKQALAVRQPVSIERYQLNPFALEPSDSKQAWDLAQAVCGSTLFRKFPNAEAALMVILEGRALGIPAVISLKNAYCVHGNVGWSARMIRGLVLKSALCEYFDIIESDTEHAVAICKRVGRPEFRVESTIDQASQRGLIKEPGVNRQGQKTEGNKWYADPLVMHVADVERRGSRMGWPDIVSGLYTPDELECGITSEGVQIIDAQ